MAKKEKELEFDFNALVHQVNINQIIQDDINKFLDPNDLREYVNKLNKYPLSYSQFSLWNTCPFQYKLNYLDGLKEQKPSLDLVFGTSMHLVLQEYLYKLYTEEARKADMMGMEQLLMDNLSRIYMEEVKKNGGRHFSTPGALEEYYNDGVEIINYFRKHRSDYFKVKDWEIVGCEVPIYYQLESNPNVMFIAFIDVVLKNTKTNIYRIIDIKTSRQGWLDKDKKNQIKLSQVRLYKKFFSERYKVNLDNIEVEFFIVKRKLYEKVDFPQKRIQIFKPSAGTVTINKTMELFNNFVNTVFTKEGKINPNIEYPKCSDDKICKYCIFLKSKCVTLKPKK